MEPMERLLFWLLEGTRGGHTRARLLSLLMKKPRNMRQLALASKLDYKTVQYHVEMLEKNSLLEKSGGKYGGIYFVSELLLAQKKYVKMIKGDSNES